MKLSDAKPNVFSADGAPLLALGGISETLKAAATAVIGHHDQDGIARYLRERFKL